MKWQDWQGTIPTSKGPVAKEGTRLGPFLVSKATSRRDDEGVWLKGPTDYSIDHIPSGTHIYAVPMGQQKLAKGIVIDLLDLDIDWETPRLDLATPALAQVWEVCHPPPKPKPVRLKTKDKTPVVWEAEYPSFFTPSADLLAYDAVNAQMLGEGKWPAYIKEASNLLGLEVMVARFTAGRNAPLLPEDAYEYAKVKGGRAFAVPDLPPGFPGGYQGCRQIVEGLWKLGGVIDALADCMITYWETAEGNTSEPCFDLSQWLAWEREFKSLVIKGWGNWALAASLFDALPKRDKEKITGVLGYVGTRKAGYDALGRKTFLRSEKLPKLREYRRLRIWGVEREYEEVE